MNTYKGPNVSYTPMAQESNDSEQKGTALSKRII